jgi:hypothetical protein
MTEFEQDCMQMYGKLLTGKYKHYCCEWDYLPIDETCYEYFACMCFDGEKDEVEDSKD